MQKTSESAKRKSEIFRKCYNTCIACQVFLENKNMDDEVVIEHGYGTIRIAAL